MFANMHSPSLKNLQNNIELTINYIEKWQIQNSKFNYKFKKTKKIMKFF